MLFPIILYHLFSSLLSLCKPLEGGGLQRLPPVLDLLQLLLELLGGEARGLGAGGDGGLLRGLGVLQDDLNVCVSNFVFYAANSNHKPRSSDLRV